MSPRNYSTHSRSRLLLGASITTLVLAGQPAYATDTNPFARVANPAVAAAQAAAAQASNGSAATAAAQRAVAAFAQASAIRRTMDASQLAARAVAAAAQANIPNGLGAGGLQAAPGATPGSPLWLNANAPTQTTSADGRTEVTVQQTDKQAILNWQTFNVGQKTDVTFDQKGNTNWAVLNRVNDPSANPTQILGTVKAPGTVLIMNRNGVIFGGTSQINVGAITAGAANISDSQFLTNGIYSSSAGVNYTPSFTDALGQVKVEAGAQITTDAPASVTAGGGTVLLLGGSVENAGTITTPKGQTLLAAGDAFNLRAGLGTTANQFSTTRGSEVAPVIAVGSTNGAVANTGSITAQQGDITLAGRNVTQDGVALATTSVNQRGTIHLLNSATDGQGSITLTGNSYTAILPELTSTDTALDSQRDGLIVDSAAQNIARGTGANAAFNNLSTLADREDQSRIEIVTGGTVEFQNGSLTQAQGGQVAVSAAKRIQADTGATIDVSGVQNVALDMASNDILINIQGNELRDSPINRDSGALFNSNVWVDARNLILVPAGTGGYATDRYYTQGGLIEVSGYLANTAHGIGEWDAAGGAITFNATEVVAQKNSLFNVAGGSLDYQGGLVRQTLLQGSDGKIYTADNAPADITMVSAGKSFALTHPRWGAQYTETFQSPFVQTTVTSYQPGYTVGRDGGQLILSTPTSIFEGTIEAETDQGDLQTDARPAGVTDPYKLGQTQAPLAGGLSFGKYTGLGLAGAYATDVQVGTNAPAIATGLDISTPIGTDRINTAWFDAGQLFGLGTINLVTSGNAKVSAPLTLANGGSLSLIAPVTEIDADVTARSGSITLTNLLPVGLGISNSGRLLTSPDGVSASIGPNAAIDLRGLWVNAFSNADTSGQAYLNGGSLNVDTTGDVTVGAGSLIDVSSGGAILASGKTLGGKGGNVTLIAGDAFAGGVPTGTLTLDGAINAAGVNGGGSLTLSSAQSIVISDQAVLPDGMLAAGQAAPTTLLLAADLHVAAGDPLPLAFFESFSTVQAGIPLPATIIPTNNAITLNAAWTVPGGASVNYIAGPFSTPAVAGQVLPVGTVVNIAGLPAGYTIPTDAFPAVIPVKPFQIDYAAGTPAPQAVTFAAGATIPAGTVFAQSTAIRPVLTLSPNLFHSGFSNYAVNGNTSVDVPDNTRIDVTVPVYQFTAQSHAAPTGADPATALSLWTPPLYLANPLTATLTQRAGGSLTLSSAVNAGTTAATGGSLIIGKGAALTVDPGQSIRLEAYGQVTVDGALTAPGGSIAILNDTTAEVASTVNATGSFDTGALSIWIGDDAVLDVAGRAVTAADWRGRAYGTAPNGGAITLGATAGPTVGDMNGVTPSTDAFIVIRPGALLDASGASAAVDLSAGAGAGAASRPAALAGNGGSIALSSYDGIYAEGTLRANAGGVGASGGALSVVLETPIYGFFIGNLTATVPDSLLVPRTITITQSDGGSLLSADLQPGMIDPTLKAGTATFSADGLTASGFDNVSLFARSAILFKGDVSLKAAQSLSFYNGALSDTDPNAHVGIAAPYIFLSGATPVGNGAPVSTYPGLSGFSQQTGTGTLTLTADQLDIKNAVSFGGIATMALLNSPPVSYDDAGFAEVNFVSTGDIRFLASPVGVLNEGGLTSIITSGNLTFTAEQLYPATGATVQLIAGFPTTSSGGSATGTLSPDSVITINSIDGVTPDMPFSAFGLMSLYAATINQGGVLRAPLGSLTFSDTFIRTVYNSRAMFLQTRAVNFLPGSVTSVSGNGLVMPYGGTADGTTYNYNGAVVSFPTTPGGISITAASVSESAGATLDLSGGGTLAGAGFVTGRGGSVNVLATPLVNADPGNSSFSAAGNKVYAIVPSFKGRYAPANADNGAGDPAVGQQVTIAAGVPGLAAGTYTLLPSNYALMPGAFRVEVGTATPTANAVLPLPNGSFSTTGTVGIANTAVRNALPSKLLLTPADTTRKYSSFTETSYSDFAIAQAAALSQLRPTLPMDARTLSLFYQGTPGTTAPALTVDGTVLFQPAKGGYGGQALVGGSDFEIVATAPTPGFTGVSLTADDLNALGAARLIVGGIFPGSLGASSGTVIVRDGATLSAGDVFLEARNQIAVESGATIDTIGKGAGLFPSTDGYTYTFPASTLAVSNGYLNIGGDITSTAAITIAAGAHIYSEGTIGLSTTGAVTIDPDARLGASYLNLAVSSINMGDTAVMAGATVPSGLLLSQSFLDTLLKGDTSTGAPALKGLILGASQSLNIFGSVDLSVTDPATGKADLTLVLNTPAIYGYGAASDATTLTVGTLYWQGLAKNGVNVLAPAVALNGPGNGAGTLNLVAGKIVFGPAPDAVLGTTAPSGLNRQIYGFSTVNLKADEISAIGPSSLSFYQAPGAIYGAPGVGGDLNLVTPLVTGTAGSVMTYTVGGALRVAPVDGAAVSTAISNALGGELHLNADTIDIGASVLLPSGRLTAIAVNDITLESGARLNLAGQPVQLQGQTVYSWGGDVSLTSTQGSITQAAGSTIDLSASNNNAGALSLSAASGNVAMNGTLNAAAGAGYGGGSFLATGQSIGDFAALNAMLDTGQVFGARQFDIKQGDLTVGGTIKAHDIEISLDNGSLTVNGLLDASGAAPGTIRLSAQDDLTLAASSVLDAHGTVLQTDSYGAAIEAKNKGAIELTASGGMLTLASGATMDLSTPDGVARGEIDLNAVRTGETSGDIQIDASGPLNIRGAKSIAVNAFQTYSPTDANGTILQDNGDPSGAPVSGTTGAVGLDQVDARSRDFIDAAWGNSGLQSRLSGLTSYGSAFHLRPGVEIVSATPTGDLTIAGDLNLAGYRYGPGVNPSIYGSGEPGALILRAGGNLLVLGSITDGFGAAPITPDDNGWTINSGSTLTGNAITTQPITLGTGTTIPTGGPALSYDIAIGAATIAANRPIPIAVITSASLTFATPWTTTADIRTPGGTVIPKGTILPAGYVIPAGSVLSVGSMVPQPVGVIAMTVPAGTPLNMFADFTLTLTADANVSPGGAIPSGTTLQLAGGGLSSGTLGSTVTVPLAFQLDTGSFINIGDITTSSFPITFGGSTQLKANIVIPFAFVSSQAYTRTGWVTAADIRNPDGSLAFAANTTVTSTLPTGTHFGAGITLLQAIRISNATIPEGTVNPSAFVNATFVTLTAPSTLQAGDVIESGSTIIVINQAAPSAKLRAPGSDGEQGKIWGASALLPAGSQSWSLRLASGADVAAADTRTLRTAATLNGAGNLILDDLHVGDGSVGDMPSFSVLRTGTGNLDLLAGGDFREDSVFGVYTAGTQSAPILTNGVDPYNLPRGTAQDGTLLGTTFDSTYAAAVANLYQANYPEDGGDVFIAVQGDLSGNLYDRFNDSRTGYPANADIGDWLWRQGGDVVGQPAAWWINFGTFLLPSKNDLRPVISVPVLTGFTGIGTLGGGNVTVSVGGAAGTSMASLSTGLDIVVASTGRVTADGTLVQTGGGNLTLKVGGTINGGNAADGDVTGTLADLRGDINVEAGRISTSALFSTGGAVIDPPGADPFAGKATGEGIQPSGLIVVPGDGVVTIDTRGDLVLDGAGDAGRATQQNATPYSAVVDGVTVNSPNGGNSWFSLWTDATAINLFSAGGNLTPSLQIRQTGGNASLAGNDTITDVGRLLFPGSLSAIAAQGNIYFSNLNNFVGQSIELAPSPIGQLNLLAGGSINGAGTAILMSGADPSVLATPFNPGFLSADGTVSNLSPNIYSNAANVLFAFGPDTVTGDLHQGDDQPIRIYANHGDIVGLQVGDILNWSRFHSPQPTPATWYIGAKPVEMIAGRDIVNSGSPLNASSASPLQDTATGNFFLNLDPNDISVVRAGRNIVFSSFAVGGPGLLDVEAGQNFYAGNHGTLTSVGPLVNVSQQNTDGGAAISLMAGVGAAGPDYTDFAKLYFNTSNQADAIIPDTDPRNAGKVPATYQDELYQWLQQRFGYGGTETDALTYFLALPIEQQGVFVRQVYFDELNAAGLEFNDPTSKRFNSYLRGRDAIAALFPDKNAAGQPVTYAGDVTMFSGMVSTDNSGHIDETLVAGHQTAMSDSGIHTDFGGGIQILVPGGKATLGNEGIVPGATSGVITQGSGGIQAYTNGSILLGQSRLLTTFGGDIMAWSATGDINAGRGSKTTVLFTPPRRVYDNFGGVTLSPQVPSSGAGIATLQPIPGVPRGNINLVAPLGTVDAGEAGIRVSGDINIAALHVLNAANIEVKGNATGLPTEVAVNTGALTAASNAASAVSNLANQMVPKPAPINVPTILTVQFLGFGE